MGVPTGMTYAEHHGHFGMSPPRPHVRAVFPADWVGTKLPPVQRHPVLDRGKGYPPEAFEYLLEVELLHVESGRTFKQKIYRAYEIVDDVTWLQDYFYSSHYCTCHRKGDVGGDIDDGVCEGNPLRIVAITAPKYLPGVVLYSETKTLAELEGG